MSDIETSTISETPGSNNAASPNGMAEGCAPSSVNDTWRENVAAQKRLFNRDHVTIASTGSDPAYILAYGTAPTNYINGGRYAFRASFANAGSATANVNGLGAKTINKHGGSGLTVLTSGDIQVAHHVTLEYDSTADVLVVVSPTPAASGSLGTMSTQNANAVAITGGTVTGITDIVVADGGTGRSTLTNHGVLVGAGTGAINQTSAGTTGQVLTSNGAAADPTFQTLTAANAGVTKQVFTASGTYTPTPGMTYAIIECLAGGGGGGGCSGGNQAAGGGGAGQYSRVYTDAATIGASKAVTIPSAAAGGSGGGSNAGSNGGTVSVGTICTAGGGKGGDGGSANRAAAGAGGSGGTSDISSTGAPGGMGGGTNVYLITITGYGGSSSFGGGGANDNTSTGNNGSGFGSGGSGANGNNAGGNGAKGIVIITEFK